MGVEVGVRKERGGDSVREQDLRVECKLYGGSGVQIRFQILCSHEAVWRMTWDSEFEDSSAKKWEEKEWRSAYENLSMSGVRVAVLVSGQAKSFEETAGLLDTNLIGKLERTPAKHR